MSRHRTRSVTRHPTATATATTRDHYMKLNKISRGVSPARADGWMVALARDARDARRARWTRRDEYPCIIYISIVVVVVASSFAVRRRAHIRMHPSRATPTRASIHPSIHPSTHPPRDATRRDASRDVSTMYTKKITHARENTTTRTTPRTWIFVALKAATRETKEDARRADIVCVCVCENAVRGAIEAEEADDATTIRTSDDATTIRTSDACMATPARAASLVRGRGRPRSMGHRVPVVVIGHIFERSGHTRATDRVADGVYAYTVYEEGFQRNQLNNGADRARALTGATDRVVVVLCRRRRRRRRRRPWSW